MGRCRLGTILVVLLCMLSAAAWCSEIVVSADGTGAYRSIQRAIDAAGYGDVIVVNPGVYEEVLILKSGITVRGAGQSHTVVRSSYGYEPVLRASLVGSVTIESLSIERSPSILEAPVVDVHASNLSFQDCRIAGGQLGGIRASGSSRLSLADCTLEGNAGYGLQVSNSDDVRLLSCRVLDNGTVGIQLSDAVVTIEGTHVEWNATDGVQVSGVSRVTCRQSTIAYNGRWGVQLFDASSALFGQCSFRTQALGNVRVGDAASVNLSDCLAEGGRESALCARGSAHLNADGIEVLNAPGEGIRITDAATLVLETVTAALCGGDGVSIESTGACSLAYVTLAYNDGDGLSCQGTDLEVVGSIVAVNAGYGIRLRSSTGGTSAVRLGFNNVWGNGSGDYAGHARPSTDTCEPPQFFDASGGDFSLATGSPVIDVGPFSTTLGAHGNSHWTPGGCLGLTVLQSDGQWGQWGMDVSWQTAADRLPTIVARWGSLGDDLRSDLSVSWIGLSQLRGRVRVAYDPSTPFAIAEWNIQPEIAVIGVANGSASYGQLASSLHMERDATSLQIHSEYDIPFGVTRQTLDASWGRLRCSTRAIDFSLRQLALAWSPALHLGTHTMELSLGCDVIPEPLLEATLDAQLGAGTIHLGTSAFLEQFGTATISAVWDEAGLRAGVTVRLRDAEFEDVEATAGFGAPGFAVSASLGANADHGPRFRLDVTVDTGHWLRPTPNLSPVPGFTIAPVEPEAGERIAFDATSSIDEDGSIDQVWWDFGDGASDLGPNVEHAYSSPGTYSVTLTVSDDRGAVTTLVEPLVIREPATTPVAFFTWAPVSASGSRLPRTARSGDNILLDASDAYDPNGTLQEYNWDLQSDGTFEITTVEPQVVIDPLASGSWPVTLRVVDADGNTDAIMHVLTITDLKPPVAGFAVSPVVPAVGDPVQFLDTSTAIDGEIVSWEWAFGDSHQAREPDPVHRYGEPGTYVIELTIRDSEGSVASVSQSLVVEVNPELVPIQEVWALLIGITDYDEVQDLSYAADDATALADWLVTHGVEPDHIRLLSDFDGTHTSSTGQTLVVTPATLLNVREALGWLRETAQRDDLVLIHFSGHGYQGADDNLDEHDGVDEFFVLQDTRAAAKDDTALRDDEFGRFLDRIASQHVLIFFDSCYSGGLSRSLSPGVRATGDTVDVFGDFHLEGRLILSASQEDQDAFESSQLEHGVFTHFLLEGLSGSADLNGDGHITAWELFGYVREEVPPFVEAERGETQIPQMMGEGETRIVLAASPITTPLSFSYCPAVPFAGASVFFRTESALDADEVTWDFGDGETARGGTVAHIYGVSGTYDVLHTRTRDGVTVSKTLSLTVAPAASVAFVEDTGRFVITVGRQHGVRIGDQFVLYDDSSSSNQTHPPVLEVVEILDETSAACILLDPMPPPSRGDLLRLVSDVAQPSCFNNP